jgi:regulator of protease activity HflC (stomatin/prohibitin superfamily)
MSPKPLSGGAAGLVIPIVIGTAVVVALLANSVVVVDTGHVGVVRTLGAVRPIALEEGFHFKKPFLDDVVQLDIRLDASNAEAKAASKDLQIVTTEVTVQYALIGPNAPKTFQSIGTREMVSTKLIEPAIQESVKAITAKYTAEELVTQRAEVKLEIHEAIREFIDKTLAQKEAQGRWTWPMWPSPISTSPKNSIWRSR